jgi:hypothetical protein
MPVPREEAGKIDDVYTVIKVLHIGLQSHEQVFSPHQLGAYRSPQRKGRLYTAPLKVYAINNLLPELLDGILYGAIEFGRQAAAIGPSERHSGGRNNLIAKAGADGVALVLRDREAAGICQRAGSVNDRATLPRRAAMC